MTVFKFNTVLSSQGNRARDDYYVSPRQQYFNKYVEAAAKRNAESYRRIAEVYEEAKQQGPSIGG